MKAPLLKDVIKTRDQSSQLISRRKIDEAVDRVAAELRAAIDEEVPLFLCVMKGGLMFTAELMKRVQLPLQLDYVHVSRYHDTVQGGSICWHKEPATDLKGRLVVLIDDIFDEGYTMQELVRYCEASGASKVLSVVLLKKNLQETHVDIEPDLAALEVSDHYLFGWGMDYKGFWRNLYDVYAVSKT